MRATQQQAHHKTRQDWTGKVKRRDAIRTALGATLTASLFSRQVCANALAQSDFIPTLRTLGSFRILEQIASAPEVSRALASPGGATVLAPTDTAFALLPNEQLSSLLLPQNAQRLHEVMLRHIIPGRLTTARYSGQLISVTSVSGWE